MIDSHACIPPYLLLLFLPAIAVCATLAFLQDNPLEAGPGLVAGYGLWTLSEYWIHRIVFHFEPEQGVGARLHWMIHGAHHDHPNDPRRLVMPPVVSLPLASAFFGLFVVAFSLPLAWSITAGFFAGYLAYDMLHYALHHARARGPIAGGCGSCTCVTISRTIAAASLSARLGGTSCSARPHRARAGRRVERPLPRDDADGSDEEQRNGQHCGHAGDERAGVLIEPSSHGSERPFGPRSGEMPQSSDRRERRDESGVEDDDQDKLPRDALVGADDRRDYREVRESRRKLDGHDRRAKRKTRSSRATFVREHTASDAFTTKPERHGDREGHAAEDELDQVGLPPPRSRYCREDCEAGTEHEHDPAGEVDGEDSEGEVQQTPGCIDAGGEIERRRDGRRIERIGDADGDGEDDECEHATSLADRGRPSTQAPIESPP